MIQVVLIDHRPLVRRSIEILLEKHPEIQAAAVSSGEENLLQLVGDIQPDVIIFDARAREFGPVTTVLEFAKVCPEGKVIALISRDQSILVRPLFDAGVRGCYFESDEETLEVDAAVCRIVKGDYCCSSEVLRHCFLHSGCNLTPQDLDILCLVAEGFSNTAIADALSVSPKTIGNRLSVLYDRLNLTGDDGKIFRVVAAIRLRALGLCWDARRVDASKSGRARGM